VWISDDEDWEDRSPTPIFLADEENGYLNKLQHMMDHMWDGFYAGQKHKSQYISMIQADRNYTMEYSGTPPKNMRYQYRGDSGQVILTI